MTNNNPSWLKLSIQQIKSYLSGKSDKDTTRQVEEEMNNSMFFSDAIDGFSESEDALDIAQNLSFDKIRSKKNTANQVFNLRRIAAAILFLVLPLAALYWWSDTASQNLYAQYHSPFPSNQYEILRGEVPSSSNLTAIDFQAHKAYAKKDYAKAIDLFQSHLKLKPEDADATFYLGLAQLEIGDYPAAIDHLETARINGDSFYEDASWYLSLAKVQVDKPDEAKLILKDLTKNENGFYFAKAKELLGSL